MSPRRQEIYELQEKVEGLQMLTGCSDSFQAFCERVGIKREALRACLNDDGKRGLSRKHQERLSASIGFSLEWAEWIETEISRIQDGSRRDTAAAFLRRCRRELFPKAERKTDEDRQYNIGLRSVSPVPPRYVDDQLATVELQASQGGPGQPWPISADIMCNPSFVAGVEVAVKRGRLKMDCGEACADTRSKPPPAGGHVIKRDMGSVSLRPGGDSRRPSLEIEASMGPIGVISLLRRTRTISNPGSARPCNPYREIRKKSVPSTRSLPSNTPLDVYIFMD